MPKIICKNENCANKQPITVYKIQSKIDKSTGNLVDDIANCPDCGTKMQVVREGTGFTTFMHGSENICKH